jgi:hypothetical protein
MDYINNNMDFVNCSKIIFQYFLDDLASRRGNEAIMCKIHQQVNNLNNLLDEVFKE